MICSERDFRHTIETMTTAMVTAQLTQTLAGGSTESGHFDTLKYDINFHYNRRFNYGRQTVLFGIIKKTRLIKA